MTENTSWLKKSAPGPSLRALHFNLPEINSTMTMQSGDGDTMTKFPKRKSCLMFKERNMIPQVPSAKKTKPSSIASNPAGFRNRTLKMVDGRNSMLPKTAAARRSMIATRRPVQKNQSTPIQMSTPFDVPRSILRPARYQEKKPPSAKKVIFDAATLDEGVFPLQESTIQDFTNYDLRKTVTKVDASTNTEATSEKEPVNTNDMMLALLKELSSKVDQLLERGDCDCKTPLPRGHPVKSFAQFMERLDNIQEVSENVTPNTQEPADNPTPATKDSTDTPKIKGIECQPLTVIQDTDLVEEQKENIVDTHSKLIVGSTKEFIVSATSSPINEENVRRSARLQVTNHVDSPQPNTSKLRKFRKRAIPRYLESFELSPKGKVKRNSGKKESN